MPNERNNGRSSRAVQYVRMSTEHQRFSIDNQVTAIAEYARERGYEIIRTYADPGKSGLTLKGRNALRSLLTDALDPNRDFDAILVLDISRWGRFQDPDQSAHYEFICRQAGVKVEYCAEPFENDLSPMSTIVKSLKRVMSGEYSRELSTKLSRAHLQQARLGYLQGGPLPYGFRRQLISEDGKPRFILAPGERKALRTDRTRIVLGPPKELKVIRAIFRLYLEEGYTQGAIAKHLNDAKVTGSYGRPWSERMIYTVLTTELCIGIYRYNTTTRKLQTPSRKNPEELWVRAAAGLRGPVPTDVFAKAQIERATRRPPRMLDETMLDGLRALLKETGRLSIRIIDKSPLVPSSATYKIHFGTVSEALRQIGYVHPDIVSGASRCWTQKQLRKSLRLLYDQHGYLTFALIANDPTLPCVKSIMRRLGRMSDLYDFIGAPHRTHEEVMRESIARRAINMLEADKSRRGLRRGWDEDSIVRRLKQLFAEHGYLSASLINADPGLPSAGTIYDRFGSLIKAYALAGWSVNRTTIGALHEALRHGRAA